MAVVLKRTVYYSKDKNGILEFHDHAHVLTALGMMVEPFAANQRPMDGAAWDYDDENNRVDEMVRIDRAQRNMILADGPTMLHGGEVWPR